MEGLKTDTELLNQIILKKHPKLINHFLAIDVSLESFLFSWMVCLFANLKINNKSYEEFIKFIVVNKRKGLFKSVLFCVKKLKKKLMKCKNNREATDLLRNSNFCFERKDLLWKIKKVKVDFDFVNSQIKRNERKLNSLNTTVKKSFVGINDQRNSKNWSSKNSLSKELMFLSRPCLRKRTHN